MMDKKYMSELRTSPKIDHSTRAHLLERHKN